MLDATAVSDVAGHVQHLRREGTAVVAFEHRAPNDTWLPGARCRILASAPPPESSLPPFPKRLDPFEITVRELGVTRGGRRVLDGINLALAGGLVVALVGANGAGKTTLLRVLAGLQRHTGRITDDRGSAPRLGLCFQNADQQIFNPTVRQEILFGNDRVDATLYRGVIDLLGLGTYEQTPPLLLSEGEKKRLALAILLTRPGLSGVCLDEPTLGQDDHHRHRIGRVVRQLAAAGYLCVLATHDLEWAVRWCDELVRLHEGRVVNHQQATAVQRSDATEEQWPAVM